MVKIVVRVVMFMLILGTIVELLELYAEDLDRYVDDLGDKVKKAWQTNSDLTGVKADMNTINVEYGVIVSMAKQLEYQVNNIENTLHTENTIVSINNVAVDIEYKIISLKEKCADLRRNLNKISYLNSEQNEVRAEIRSEINNVEIHIKKINTQIIKHKEVIKNVYNITVNEKVADEKDKLVSDSCYYAIGTKEELLKNKIIEVGFFGGITVKETGFDKSFFIPGKKTSISMIPLYSEKAEVLSAMPENSYSIRSINGQKVLAIVNVDNFWSKTDYLVVIIESK